MMGKVQINPRTQIRWVNDEIPEDGDIPLDSLPEHSSTHGSGGSDPVSLATSQVVGLDAILASLPYYLRSDTGATVSGAWTFTQPVSFVDITATTLTVDVVHFNAIARPDDLAAGELYRDTGDGRLYIQTDQGLKQIAYTSSAPVASTKARHGLAQAFIAGNPHYALAQALALISPRRGVGQAQARIKAVGRGFGQAQAKLRGKGFQHAQAAAQINSVPQGYAQAMAFIRYHIQPAQAQAVIVKPYPNLAFGLARAKIKAIGVSKVAQAQAFIKR